MSGLGGRDLRESKEDPKTIATYCNVCNGTRVLDVKGIYHYTPRDTTGEYVPEIQEVAVLGACTECHQPVLASSWESLDDPDYHASEYHVLYPRDKGSKRKLKFSLPKIITKSYDEAVRCENSKAWNACAVMVGRALEAVAKDYDPKVKTIATGIEKMHEAGAISSELLEWANALRFLRNIGAHASPTDVEELDARESLDFLQAILETIYHLRPMFEKMKKRRK